MYVNIEKQYLAKELNICLCQVSSCMILELDQTRNFLQGRQSARPRMIPDPESSGGLKWT
jgi:hypothetical protein